MYRSTVAPCLSKCTRTDSQIDHCNLMEIILCTCFVFSRASITFLMYIRVCAVYNMNRIIILFFGFTWLSVIAGAATLFGSLEGIYIGPKSCMTLIKHEYFIAGSACSFINDTLIFLAIMYKLGMADIRRSTTLHMISTSRKPTGHLQSLTRVLLQDSQIYYL